MADSSYGIIVLNEDECWRLVEKAEVGRLGAVAVAGEPEIFPVNHVLDGRILWFKTAEGTKLAALTISHALLSRLTVICRRAEKPGASSSRGKASG